MTLEVNFLASAASFFEAGRPESVLQAKQHPPELSARGLQASFDRSPPSIPSSPDPFSARSNIVHSDDAVITNLDTPARLTAIIQQILVGLGKLNTSDLAILALDE